MHLYGGPDARELPVHVRLVSQLFIQILQDINSGLRLNVTPVLWEQRRRVDAIPDPEPDEDE